VNLTDLLTTLTMVTPEAADTTCFPLIVKSASGSQTVHTNAGLTFNAATSVLGATGLVVATSETCPLVIGGTGVASTLTLRATSGVGAAGSDIIFQVGNNGATEAGRIGYDGRWLMGKVTFSATAYTLDAQSPTTMAIRATRYSTSATTGLSSALVIQKTTTQDMADTFGVRLAFNICDSAGVDNPIGYVGAYRAGADNTGNLVLQVVAAGSIYDCLTLTSTQRVGICTATPSYDLSFGGEVARGITMERRTAADSAGQNLLIVAGGATIGASSKAGGDLKLYSGISTGAGSSDVVIHAYPITAPATVDGVPREMARFAAALVTIGNTTLASATTIQCGTGAMTFTAGGIWDVNAVGAATIDCTSMTFTTSLDFDVNATGHVNIDSAHDEINIGADANAYAINIGTGAAARQITVGNDTTTTGVAINTGTADLVVNTDMLVVDQSTKRVGAGTAAPTSWFDIEHLGTAKSIVDFLEITNTVNRSDMDGTGTGIVFNQWYYHAVTPAVATAARIDVVTETDWTSSAASRDAYMSFSSVRGGAMLEKVKIDSDGHLRLVCVNDDGGGAFDSGWLYFRNSDDSGGVAAAAKQITFERCTQVSVTGAALSIYSGGCKAGEANLNGGILKLIPGVSTGTASSTYLSLYGRLVGLPATSLIDNNEVEVLRTGAKGVYIGPACATPTAYLHLKAGTATASTAPAKFTTGTMLATAEAGAVELDVGSFWMTPISTQREAVVGCVYAQYDSMTVVGKDSEATLMHATNYRGAKTLVANFFGQTGKTLRITAAGIYIDGANTTGTLTLKINVGGINVLDSGAMSIAGLIGSNMGWSLDALITCQTTGATGHVWAQGKCIFRTSATPTHEILDMENTATSAHIDMTAACDVDVTATFSVATGDNSITCTNLIIEALD
jgi:hypothetical protein